MRQIRIHADPDWCHLCGRQGEHQVDVYYPEDARQAGACTPNTRYLRMCSDCIAELYATSRLA
jgi:hypothetical protein